MGSAGERHDGFGNLHAVMGRTLAGLHVTEAAMTGTYEVHIDGFRFGPGGGINLLNIVRATDGGNTTSAGFVTLLRAGYDFGVRPGAFILGQYALDLYRADLDQGAPTFSGETTLMAGARF